MAARHDLRQSSAQVAGRKVGPLPRPSGVIPPCPRAGPEKPQREHPQVPDPAAAAGDRRGTGRLLEEGRGRHRRDRRRAGIHPGRSQPARREPLQRGRPGHHQGRLHRLRRLCQRHLAGRQPGPGRPHQLGRVRDARRAFQRRAAPAGRAGRRRCQRHRREEDRRRPVGHRHGRGEDQRPGHRAAGRPPGRDRRAGRRRRRGRIPAHQRRQGPGLRVRLRRRSRLPEPGHEHRLRDAGRPGPAGQQVLHRRRQGRHPRGLRRPHRQGAGAVGRRRRSRRRSRPPT
jgi:hypothetical protein